jgi:hypothetical protein
MLTLQLSLALQLLLLLLLCFCQNGLQVSQLAVPPLAWLHVSPVQQRQPRHPANHLQRLGATALFSVGKSGA